MNTATLLRKTKAAKCTRWAVDQILTAAERNNPLLRPVYTTGRGKYTSNMDRTHELVNLCKALGLTYTTGNDAPRGGACGAWMELDQRSRRILAGIRKDKAAEAKAKKDAEEAAKAQEAANLARLREEFTAKRGTVGADDPRAVLLAWWASEAFHPAPEEVVQAKWAAGMTWKEVRDFCRAAVSAK